MNNQSHTRNGAAEQNSKCPHAHMLRRLFVLCALPILALTGCHAAGNGSSDGNALSRMFGEKDAKSGLPQRHSITAEQLVVMSNLKLGAHHPLVEELKVLRDQVHENLDLPKDQHAEKVTVYLFENEMAYKKYIGETYPGLPFRRAYFIGTPEKLAVYTFWGERIREDLRHEYTHGLLHASLQTVPLWLDEGLAEYFEVPGLEPGTVNNDYAVRLARAVQTGWRPDIHRLERLETVDEMQREDYRESWAWVHFMLHSSPDSRQVLLDYLKELRYTAEPPELSMSLAGALPQADARFLNYVATLNTYRRWMSSPMPEQYTGPKRRGTVSRANAP